MYNADLDKITEFELVSDFVERLKLGKKLEVSLGYNVEEAQEDKITFNAGTRLLDLFIYILPLLSDEISSLNKKIKTHSIKISKSTMSINETISDNLFDNRTDYKLFRAYSDKTGMDLSSIFVFQYDAGKKGYTISTNFDTQYVNDDIIKLYFTL